LLLDSRWPHGAAREADVSTMTRIELLTARFLSSVLVLAGGLLP
jgi:hypothetical protein